MKKLSVLLIIQGIFCFISAILLFVAAAKIKAMTNGYYEPGFELTLYILIALELIVIGIVNFVVAIAIDNDANKLEKVCNDVKNMQQQSNNK